MFIMTKLDTKGGNVFKSANQKMETHMNHSPLLNYKNIHRHSFCALVKMSLKGTKAAILVPQVIRYAGYIAPLLVATRHKTTKTPYHRMCRRIFASLLWYRSLKCHGGMVPLHGCPLKTWKIRMPSRFLSSQELRTYMTSLPLRVRRLTLCGNEI